MIGNSLWELGLLRRARTGVLSRRRVGV